MKKTFLEMVETVVTATILTAILSYLCNRERSIVMLLSDNALHAVIILAVNDMFFRWHRYRVTMNRHYVLLMLQVAVGIVGFALMKEATGLVQNYLGLVLFLLGTIGAIIYYVKVYSFDVSSTEELADRKLKDTMKAFRKAESLTAFDVASVLEGVCAYRFKNDDPEGGYDYDRPFAGDCAPVAEMTDQSAIEDGQRYLLQCATAWLERCAEKKEKKSKKKKEEKHE